MSVRSGMCATCESDMHDSGDGNVRDDADDDRVGERAVRGTAEPGGMRILPERVDGDLSGVPDRDGNTATTARKDSDNGSDAGV